MFIAPKIVARNFTEAHSFARDILGLRHGQYRVVTSPASLVGRVGEVYLVPGWDKRPDRWAIRNKLKYSRLTIIDVAKQETPAEEPETSNGDNMVSEGAPVFTIFSDPEAWLKETDDSLRPADSAPLFEVPDSLLEEIADDVTKNVDALDRALGGPGLAEDDKPAEEQEVAEDVEPEPETDDEDNDVKEDDSDKDVEDERPLNGRRRRRCKDCGELIHPDDVEDHARDHAADMVSLEQKAQENLR